MAQTINPADEIRSFYGEGLVVSDWFTVDQRLMNIFAEATLDPDWMHIDPQRAKRDGPFDGTIAFGFWTMSMLSYFARQTSGGVHPPSALYGFNYGFDRVRLMSPVPVGSRIRNVSSLQSIDHRGNGRYLVGTENRIEIEGSEKPAMIAQWYFMLIYPEVQS